MSVVRHKCAKIFHLRAEHLYFGICLIICINLCYLCTAKVLEMMNNLNKTPKTLAIKRHFHIKCVARAAHMPNQMNKITRTCVQTLSSELFQMMRLSTMVMCAGVCVRLRSTYLQTHVLFV